MRRELPCAGVVRILDALTTKTFFSREIFILFCIVTEQYLHKDLYAGFER